jgi:MYXO-CTERM domain-containing protein
VAHALHMARPMKWALAMMGALFLGCSAAPSIDGVTGSSSAALVTATGVDYSWARPSPSGLKSDGYTFAARYLSYDTTGKNLSATEAKDLWAAGVDVVANWEDSGTAALNGYSQGVSDAKSADAQANEDGIPAGRPIYFSVDFDATPAEEATITAYFQGVASVIGLARTGAYGGYYVIKSLFDGGTIKWGWQTYAWSGGQWDSRAQFRQVQNDITAAGDTGCCDEDQAVDADFGQWHAAPANTPPRGYLDSAACTAIAGWAQDPDSAATALDVDLSFDGAAGASGTEAMRIVAGDNRADLCKAIGSCDHGFSVNVPLGMLDGKSHPVYAYGIDTKGGPNTLLTDSPKSFQCPNAAPPLDAHAGVKRHVVSPASMTAWSFSMLTDVAPEPESVVDAYPQSADWGDKPSVVQADDGTPEVWLLDGEVRRHVINPASLAAWHWTGSSVVKAPAAKVYAYAQGPDLPATPFLVMGTGPAIYVVDVAPSTPPGAPAADAGAMPNGDTSTASGGCSVNATPAGAPWWLLSALALAARLRRRRVESPVT